MEFRYDTVTRPELPRTKAQANPAMVWGTVRTSESYMVPFIYLQMIPTGQFTLAAAATGAKVRETLKGD